MSNPGPASTSTTAFVGGGSPQYLGTAASTTVGFYGKVPVVQRPYSSAVHATSAASVSSSFGATQLAILQEIQNTLIGLGIWATV
jgi:hypothetical protein